MFEQIFDSLSPFFVDATCFVLHGLAFGTEIAEHTFLLADGRVGVITNECSGVRLCFWLMGIAMIRLRRKDMVSWLLLALSPLVAIWFNAVRCMIVLGRGMTFHDLGGFAVFAIPVLFYAMRPERVVRTRPFKAVAILAVSILGVWESTPAYANDNKQTVIPTVRGITLGEPMESPSHVTLSWHPDAGQEIKPTQRVRVYWRDANNPGWHMAAEGYGITSATVSGFYINRDTDWIVEVHGEEGGAQ